MTKIDLEKKMNSEFKKLLANPDLESLDYSAALDEFHKQLELEKKPQNFLLLPGDKLAELLSLDAAPISRLQKEYIKVKDAIQPNVEDYTTYAISNDERERHAACISVIKAITTAKPHIDFYGGNHNPLAFTRAFTPLIIWDTDTMKFIPNYIFIKNYF
jgi:hypothetical protein